MAVTWSYAVDLFLGGVWTDVTSDIRRAGNSITFGGGIRGTGPTDRVASPGTLTMVMNNITRAGVVGRYSPDSANKLPNLAIGVAIRVREIYNGTTRYKWLGTITAISPEAGNDVYTSTITAVDWIDEATRYQVKGVPTLLATDANAVLTAVLAAMPKQPNAVSLGAGSDAYPFAPAAGPSAQYSAMSEFQRVTMTELGYLALRGTTNFATTAALTFIPRNTLVQSPFNGALSTLNNDTRLLSASHSRETVLNVFKITVHPRKFDVPGLEVLLYAKTDPVSVDPGATISWMAQYSDPAQAAVAVAAYGVLAPVNGSTLFITSNSDGTGTDLFANFTVTASAGSNTIFYSFTNNGATTGYVRVFAYGCGIYDYDAVEVEVRDAASVTAYGECPVSIDLTYQVDVTFGKNVGAYLLPYWKDPATQVPQVMFFGNHDDPNMLAALDREVGDVISLVESTTAVNKLFRIMSWDHEITEEGFLYCTWGLCPMVDVTDYWILEEVGSQLGTNTRVAL